MVQFCSQVDENMSSGLCWTHLWIVVLLRSVSADSVSRYTIHRSQASFDQAKQTCSRVGVLTTFTTKQQLDDILLHISRLEPRLEKVTFWVGLKKEKDACVVPSEPLRGFKWTDGGSEDSGLIRWSEEPKQTCTSVRCAALTVNFNGSELWGLISASCKNTHRFICRLRDGPTTTDRTTLDPAPATSETAEPPTPAKLNPESATPEPKVPTEPEPETRLKPTSAPEVVGPGPGPGSGQPPDSCKVPIIHDARSFKQDSGRSIQVECWSNDRLELQCGGRPTVWRLPDKSPANFTTICRRCRVGYKKDASANCVDIDECSSGSAHCNHTCLNTDGSHRCVCVDESGKHHEEGSPACPDPITAQDTITLSKTLVPMLVAVVALVVLVVVVTVTVKCCLMRKSKKKKAEKMAMKSKDSADSFITANETR